MTGQHCTQCCKGHQSPQNHWRGERRSLGRPYHANCRRQPQRIIDLSASLVLQTTEPLSLDVLTYSSKSSRHAAPRLFAYQFFWSFRIFWGVRQVFDVQVSKGIWLQDSCREVTCHIRYKRLYSLRRGPTSSSPCGELNFLSDTRMKGIAWSLKMRHS